MLQNTRLERNGRRRARSDMNDSCVKISYYIKDREHEISFILADFLFHPQPGKFEMCGVLNANYVLWATMGPLETFGNRVVDELRFRFW